MPFCWRTFAASAEGSSEARHGWGSAQPGASADLGSSVDLGDSGTAAGGTDSGESCPWAGYGADYGALDPASGQGPEAGPEGIDTASAAAVGYPVPVQWHWLAHSTRSRRIQVAPLVSGEPGSGQVVFGSAYASELGSSSVLVQEPEWEPPEAADAEVEVGHDPIRIDSVDASPLASDETQGAAPEPSGSVAAGSALEAAESGLEFELVDSATGPWCWPRARLHQRVRHPHRIGTS